MRPERTWFRALPPKKNSFPVASGVAVNPSLFFYTTVDVDTQGEDRTLTVRVHTLDRDGKETKLDERVIHRGELTPGF